MLMKLLSESPVVGYQRHFSTL